MSLESKEPIRGWLILFAIVLWLAPFYSFLLFVGGLVNLHLHHLRLDIVTVEGFIGIIMSTILLVLFMKRKAAFIKTEIVYQIYSLFLETALLLVDIHLHNNLIFNAMGYLEIIVILLYVIRSKRVKRTFVEKGFFIDHFKQTSNFDPQVPLTFTDKLKQFIGPKADYYFRKWDDLDHPKILGWNWGAAIFTLIWLGYRKMYGFVCLYFGIAFILFMISLIMEFNLLEWIGITVVNLLFATFGNYLYWIHSRNKLKKVENQQLSPGDENKFIQKKGGITWFGVLITLFLLMLIAVLFLSNNVSIDLNKYQTAQFSFAKNWRDFLRVHRASNTHKNFISTVYRPTNKQVTQMQNDLSDMQKNLTMMKADVKKYDKSPISLPNISADMKKLDRDASEVLADFNYRKNDKFSMLDYTNANVEKWNRDDKAFKKDLKKSRAAGLKLLRRN